ncbi:uncharacterized protein Z520_06504 [Fonsecaea multimorphosa CBS 102226]|uniref:Uncharacterized protein n=1 Tax=Fonsecaea multimorphosa CBS 102226 TaxID=1442371 RepID=A0A0D2IL36_9EURO|nr:uncharacterized protein Z520_06504 [Fonsecaea multimorphosa CBS 102226]KIX97726.1 hypothetical protein Z520_06504 [Fonsecaea multimorphosa CBS 102226]OAL23889.1 hypothetical protein AYO22_06065 [Fonsecaea multimorphosa]
MSFVLEIYHAVQACGSVYVAMLSAMAIYNLRQWEPQTESASRYSNAAARQLHKTRTTEASGVLATLFSLVSSVILVVAVSSGRNSMPFLLSAANAGALVLAYNHIANFWHGRPTVPLASSYNDGVRSTKQMLQALGGLTISWAASTVIYLFRAIVY